MPNCRLNVGSLILHLSYERDLYPNTLAEIFCTAARPVEKDGSPPHAVIAFVEREDIYGRRPLEFAVPEDGMVIVDAPSAKEIHSEALSVHLTPGQAPVRIVVEVLRPRMDEYELKVHVTVVLFKILFLLDYLALHAAAVLFQERVNLFLGGKGTGKSTTALQLASNGGAVLGEDRVLLRKAGGRFFVSGSGDKSRVTAKTESHFFFDPLQIEARDSGGVLKKEFSLGRFFSSMPYRDYPVDRIFFNRVGGRFQITALSRQEALLELIRETNESHRFAGGEDLRRYLGYLRGFVEAAPAFRLDLSQDLAELEKLTAFLRVHP